AFMRVPGWGRGWPRFFLMVRLVGLLGGGLTLIVVARGLTAWRAPARLFRAQVLSLKSRDFVTAARAAGAGDFTVLWRHALPIALPVLAAQMSYQAGGAILGEAGLRFFGLGGSHVVRWGTQLG